MAGGPLFDTVQETPQPLQLVRAFPFRLSINECLGLDI